MLKTLNQKVSIVLLVLSAGYLYLTFNLKEYPYVPIDSDFIPKVLGYILIALSILLYFDRSSESDKEKAKRQVSKEDVLALVGVGALIILYIVLFEWLGFLLTTALFVFSCSWALGYRRILSLVLVSVLFPSVLYYLFNYLLQIRLPEGILPF
ncbi:hypothetical protein N781_11485 [Pontibacillus halophilus JSM 076056 = DSM 19796]|uniref:DUF1468 domain-containing protein n=1 Tax=Pontibacillus halophilus JSM 076056 = DSM 19796 TaxID=1385510 RepID=A0A0A5GAG7_9BACI|nr:tripartite tricarboxylate transporter TctB family protein [Pontibacillus halophilus]KGX88100.1 hypothetical protein N781_11485 [Pontibacillus halophilus JSM 076056 = DSM 19796]